MIQIIQIKGLVARLIIIGVLASFAGAQDIVAEVLLPNEKCEGLAIVWPPANLNGSIYLSQTPIIDSTAPPPGKWFPPTGYLPAGTVVTLYEPAEKVNGYCGFKYRWAVAGQVSAKQVEKISKHLPQSESAESLFVISPTNPFRPLELRIDNSREPIRLSRNSERLMILASAADVEARGEEIKVMLQQGGKFKTAYVKRQDDRAIDIDGSFRKFSLQSAWTASERAPVAIDNTPSANRFLASLPPKLTDLLTRLKQAYQGLPIGACGHKEVLKGTVDGGLKFYWFNVSAAGEVSWEKPQNEAIQYGLFGANPDQMVSIYGRAKCDNFDPTYLEGAQIFLQKSNVIDDMKTVSISRAEFFEAGSYATGLDEDINSIQQVIEFLRSNSSAQNAHRDRTAGISQLVTIPFNPRLDSKGTYYTYFDLIERYLAKAERLQEPLPARERFTVDDDLALALLVQEALSLWWPSAKLSP
jgi:hypothetical protein